ncbi:MAG: hypothetical protein PVI87_04670 [Gammaproteobacteria bacterium]|jgi:TolB-like protein
MQHPDEPLDLPHDLIRSQLDRMLGHEEFIATDKMRDFLRFVVEETLAGNARHLKGFTIAMAVFGRDQDFDPAHDPVVRIQAGRLRRAIERYYLVAGADDPVHIDIPKGSYVPVFSTPEANEEPPAAVSLSVNGDWPSILLLPFDDMTGSPELAYLGPGLATELCMELGSCSDLRVMLSHDQLPGTPESTATPDFVVRGSVRLQDSEIKVVVQLARAATGEQLWVDSLKTSVHDKSLLTFQERAAAAICAHIAGEHGVIFRALSAGAEGRATAETSSYQAILKGYSYHQKVDRESWEMAFHALHEAHRRDPGCGLVCTMLSVLYLDNLSMELADPALTPLAEALHLAREGARLEPRNQFCRLVLARAHLLENNLEAGLQEADAALALHPDSLLFMDAIGYLLALLGDWERGEAMIRKAVRLNPYYRVFTRYATWLNAFRKEDYAQALEETEWLQGVAYFWDPLARAATLVRLGRQADSEAAVQELLALKPDFPQRGRALISQYVKPPELQDRLVESLAEAGLSLENAAD